MKIDEAEALPLEAAATKSKLSPQAQALIKTVGGATVVLYAMGWAFVFARQEAWAPSVRATYAYQAGWVSCLAVCAVALVLRRGQAAVAPETTQAQPFVSGRPRVRRRRFAIGGATK